MKFLRSLSMMPLLALASSAVWAADEPAGVKPETTALYRAAREQVDKLATTPAIKYAPEVVAQATKAIAAAQSGLESGNDSSTRYGAEQASLTARLAIALADQRIATEKATAVRKELSGLENRLNLILAGKGEQP